MQRVASTMLIVLTLFGCVVGPNYKRPSVDTPQAWRFEDKEAKDVANTAWWEKFNDPMLTKLISIALSNNKDLKIATSRVEEFMGRYTVARAILFPQIIGNAGVESERTSELEQVPLPSGTPNPFNLYQVSLSASWETDLWGKLRRGTEAALANMLGTEEGRRGVILTLVTSVANSYVNLLDLDRQLEIARNTAKTREESYRIFQVRFRAGYVSELELSQARSDYEQVYSTIAPLEKAIAQQENALSILLGRNPEAIQRGGTLNDLGMPSVPAGLPSDILEQRPDIRQAEQNLIAANAQIGAAKAQFFPDISLTSSFGWESTKISSLFTNPALSWNLLAPMTIPIFTSESITGQVKTAEAIREETLLQYQQTIQSAFRDVEDALVDQDRTQKQLAAQSRQVEALRTYARVARLRYDNGYTSYITVLDAERNLFNAELSHAQTQGALFEAMINLYKAMGGGWVVMADKLENERKDTGISPVSTTGE